MADNLIYGKSVRDFGAVGDGNSDDTKAFTDAFSSGETLISVPYGKYTVNAPLEIGGGVKIECHKKAEINFKGIKTAKDAGEVRIRGGIWHCTDKKRAAFDFCGASCCVIEQISVSTESDAAVILSDCSEMTVDNVRFTKSIGASALVFDKKAEYCFVSGADFTECDSGINFTGGSEVKHVYFSGIRSDSCKNIIKATGAGLFDVRFTGVSGNAHEYAALIEKCSAGTVIVRDISVHDGYFKLSGNNIKEKIEISDFRRLCDLEKSESEPSLEVSSQACSVICDGVALDAVILAKKSIPDIKMTAARMASPLSSFKYTFEADITEKERFILPTGGFESLEITGCSKD